MNTLYYGDNLEVLQRHIKDESVDLIYLDPPFNSNANYNVLFAQKDGKQSSAQIHAFEDTWQWDENAIQTYTREVEKGGPIADALRAFNLILGDSNMMAYLTMMAPRLKELHRVLKPTGSLYLHCDPTASHYLKVLLDMVFGAENFRNEIIWRRTGAHGAVKSFGPIHDTLLFYTKTGNYFFKNQLKPYMKGHVETRYKQDLDGRFKFTSGGNVLTGPGATSGESGAEWRGFRPSDKKRHWAVPGFLTEKMPSEFASLGTLAKLDMLYENGLIEIKEGAAWPTPVRYLADNEGQPLQDIWAYQPYTERTVYGTDDGIDQDVAWLGTTTPERLGYQTQKPLGLLSRVIQCSCPESGTVLDPFCGCGTAIAAAQKLGRQWIGIDITHLAIGLIKRRMEDAFGDSLQYEIIGEPTTVDDARSLAEQDKYQFQWWALGLVGARPADQKKGADHGIDGRIYFHDDNSGKTKQVILSVKGGSHVNVSHIRDLIGVLEREKAEIGVYLSLEEASKPMRAEAAQAGFYHSETWNRDYPRVQILTIAELLDGKQIDMPPIQQVNQTFRRARREKGGSSGQMDLLGGE